MVSALGVRVLYSRTGDYGYGAALGISRWVKVMGREGMRVVIVYMYFSAEEGCRLRVEILIHVEF